MLPSAIIIVEGKTDRRFLEALVSARFPDWRVLVIDSEGNVKRRVHELRTMLGGLAGTPYEARTFVVLDSVHTRGTKEDLQNLGVPASNIVVWSKNGIEYYYPPTIMAKLFGLGTNELNQLVICDSDVVEANGFQRRKEDLCIEVCKQLTPDTEMADELEAKLLLSLQAVLV
ncbi:hypothetical protein [Microvirga aerophila]|uniref:DUF4435 domain-containing protein n=1 Tax=Microvirga aerophila TaxID=670291 RepID=A0A512C3B5_9HYPH|nr:hypothetical protein [Microvirga aerophila]GEO18704.1 hypothetical protein MAE02_64000 [Microvirga aerophila]